LFESQKHRDDFGFVREGRNGVPFSFTSLFSFLNGTPSEVRTEGCQHQDLQ